MPRAKAKHTQADIARAVRALAQANTKGAVDLLGDGTIRVLVGFDPPAPKASSEKRKIVL